MNYYYYSTISLINYHYYITMAPSYWKDFIYVVCCCLGDEYLDEIDTYNKAERERLCPKQPKIQQNAILLRKAKSCYFPKLSTNKNGQKEKRNGLKWIIGDEFLNQEN